MKWTPELHAAAGRMADNLAKQPRRYKPSEYYSRSLPTPSPSRCCVCGRESFGLWCGQCLDPYIERGEWWKRQPGSNVITVRRAPREESNGR